MSAVPAALFRCPLGEDAALIPRTVAIAEAYQALLEANHARLARWFPGAFDTPPTLERTCAELERGGRAWLDGSQLPLAIMLPSGENAIVQIQSLCPTSDWRTFPVEQSHSRTILSPPPLASVVLPGENASAETRVG